MNRASSLARRASERPERLAAVGAKHGDDLPPGSARHVERHVVDQLRTLDLVLAVRANHHLDRRHGVTLPHTKGEVL